jgi:hypothetical protein
MNVITSDTHHSFRCTSELLTPQVSKNYSACLWSARVSLFWFCFNTWALYLPPQDQISNNLNAFESITTSFGKLGFCHLTSHVLSSFLFYLLVISINFISTLIMLSLSPKPITTAWLHLQSPPFWWLMTTQFELTKIFKYNWDFQVMGVETPPKYVNRELNSQIGIRGQNSHI